MDERGDTVAESAVRVRVGRVRRELEAGRVTVTIPHVYPPGEEAEAGFGGSHRLARRRADRGLDVPQAAYDRLA